MTKKQIEQQRLKEVSRLIDTLTERMMTAYVVGSRPAESEVMAFCQGILLLQEHGVPLPHFADDVIARLQTQDDANQRPSEAPVAAPVVRSPSVLGRLLRPFKMLQAA